MTEQTANLCTTDAAESLREIVERQEREIERLRLNIAEYNEHERCYQEEIVALKEGQSILILARDEQKRLANEYRDLWSRAAVKAQPSGVVLADDIRAACQNAVEVFAEETNATQCREVAEYMREVLLARLNSSPVSAGVVDERAALRDVVTDALMGMIAAVTSSTPPANEPPPPFIQSAIDRAVDRIASLDASRAQLAAPAGVPVAWQFYQDGKWWNGDDRIKDHRTNTEAAGYPVRDLYAAAPSPAPAGEYPSCDYCGFIPGYHPWHGSGVINGVESRHIHACDDCRGKLPAPAADAWMIPTANQLEQALESVPSFHDLSAELIAPAMLEHLRSVITMGEYGDPYQGAREDLAIWKRRALEAETKIREQDQIIENLGNALNDENGPNFMGEPVLKPASDVVPVPRELLEEIVELHRRRGVVLIIHVEQLADLLNGGRV